MMQHHMLHLGNSYFQILVSKRESIEDAIADGGHNELYMQINPKYYLISACIFFISMILMGAIPGEATTLSAKVGDKRLHFLAYSFLSFLFYGGLIGTTTVRRVLKTLAIIALLGGMDEAIQSFMPYRNANMDDWIIDMIAASTAITASILINLMLVRWQIIRNASS